MSFVFFLCAHCHTRAHTYEQVACTSHKHTLHKFIPSHCPARFSYGALLPQLYTQTHRKRPPFHLHTNTHTKPTQHHFHLNKPLRQFGKCVYFRICGKVLCWVCCFCCCCCYCFYCGGMCSILSVHISTTRCAHVAARRSRGRRVKRLAQRRRCRFVPVRLCYTYNAHIHTHTKHSCTHICARVCWHDGMCGRIEDITFQYARIVQTTPARANTTTTLPQPPPTAAAAHHLKAT